MKHISSILTVALIALLSLSFTSCDEDSYIAYTLDGTWKGTTRVSSYDTYISTIRFFQKDSYGGYGYEYSRKGWREDYACFEWEVRNGNIYLYYDDGFDAVIYQYRMYDDVLYGLLTDRNCGWNQAEISWTKVSNNWDSGYNSWYDRYYAKRPDTKPSED